MASLNQGFPPRVINLGTQLNSLRFKGLLLLWRDCFDSKKEEMSSKRIKTGSGKYQLKLSRRERSFILAGMRTTEKKIREWESTST